MKPLLTTAVSICTFAYLATGVWSSLGDHSEARFSVHSHGMKVGDIVYRTTVITGSKKDRTLKISSDTHIKANMLFKSYSLESREEAIVGKNGTAGYAREGRENGITTKVAGHLENSRFSLTVTENNNMRKMVFPRSSYDFTTMDCPEILMKQPGQKMSVRLLNLETLEIVNRRYHFVKSEELTIKGKSRNCMVIDFEDKNKKCRSWIINDENGVMIARQEGSGRAGSYSVRLISHFSR